MPPAAESSLSVTPLILRKAAAVHDTEQAQGF